MDTENLKNVVLQLRNNADFWKQYVSRKLKLNSGWDGLSTDGSEIALDTSELNSLLPLYLQASDEVKIMGIAPSTLLLENFQYILGAGTEAEKNNSFLYLDEALANLNGCGDKDSETTVTESVKYDKSQTLQAALGGQYPMMSLPSLLLVFPKLLAANPATLSLRGKTQPGSDLDKMKKLNRKDHDIINKDIGKVFGQLQLGAVAVVGNNQTVTVTKSDDINESNVIDNPELLFLHREYRWGDLTDLVRARRAVVEMVERRVEVLKKGSKNDDGGLGSGLGGSGIGGSGIGGSDIGGSFDLDIHSKEAQSGGDANGGSRRGSKTSVVRKSLTNAMQVVNS